MASASDILIAMSGFDLIPSGIPPGPDVADTLGLRGLLTQAAWKLFFGGQGEILICEVSLNRNYDSPA